MKKGLVALVVAGGLIIAARSFISDSTRAARAEPLAQTTATPRPTEEPTKSPYVFPTPIFIPTFPPDTLAPTATRVTPPAGAQTYTIEAGDSPWTIAGKVYGDPTKFRLIMDANGITDQTRLRTGQVLIIPPLKPLAIATATPLPIATVTIAPTIATLPTATIANLPTPTSAPAASANDPIRVGLTILAGILLTASAGAGALAYLTFRRAQRLPPIRPLQPVRVILPPPETLKKK
ncbi:MAG: LysM peptidoglycan-binding domain-containing protein [Chloroflexi bacterium]|nr:LysM peptidoglycan-binding domain-containing protein [Chloroflexota bacterium]